MALPALGERERPRPLLRIVSRRAAEDISFVEKDMLVPPENIQQHQPAIAPGRLTLLSADFSTSQDYTFGVSVSEKRGVMHHPGSEVSVYGREHYLEAAWTGGQQVITTGRADGGEWQYKIVDLKLQSVYPTVKTVYSRIDSQADHAEYAVSQEAGEARDTVISVNANLGRDGRFTMTMRARAIDAISHGMMPGFSPSQWETIAAVLQEDPYAVIEERVAYCPRDEKNIEQVRKMFSLTYYRRSGEGFIPESLVCRSNELYHEGTPEYTDQLMPNTASPITAADAARHEAYVANRSRMPASLTDRVLDVPVFLGEKALIPA